MAAGQRRPFRLLGSPHRSGDDDMWWPHSQPRDEPRPNSNIVPFRLQTNLRPVFSAPTKHKQCGTVMIRPKLSSQSMNRVDACGKGQSTPRYLFPLPTLQSTARFHQTLPRLATLHQTTPAPATQLHLFTQKCKLNHKTYSPRRLPTLTTNIALHRRRMSGQVFLAAFHTHLQLKLTAHYFSTTCSSLGNPRLSAEHPV